VPITRPLCWAAAFSSVGHVASCLRDASGMPQGCLRDVSAMPQGCLRDASAMPQRCDADVSAMCCAARGPRCAARRTPDGRAAKPAQSVELPQGPSTRSHVLEEGPLRVYCLDPRSLEVQAEPSVTTRRRLGRGRDQDKPS
jgi:hypothetical protein